MIAVIVLNFIVNIKSILWKALRSCWLIYKRLSNKMVHKPIFVEEPKKKKQKVRKAVHAKVIP